MAFERYCERYARGAEVERIDAPFFARVRSWRLDRTLVFAREDGCIRHRRRERVASDGLDHFVLSHVIGGKLCASPDGWAGPIGPGESVLLDTAEPSESSTVR